MTAAEFEAIMTADKRKFLEAKTKHGRIESSYWLSPLKDKNVNLSQPLDEFDRAIVDSYISAQVIGNPCITATGIWRGITGKSDAEPTPALKREILRRVDRLACIRLTVDLSDACDKKIYPAEMTCKSMLLPCDIIETKLNGQIVDGIIYFNGTPPLLRLAQARSKKKQVAQILTYDVDLLNVPNQRHTPTTIKITNYIVRRVEESKQHSNMARTILLSTLIRQCGLEDADRFKKRNMRKIIEAVMKSLIDKGEIESFELVKDHGQFTKITFNFKQGTTKSE